MSRASGSYADLPDRLVLLHRRLEDVTEAHRIASEAADRFRDVVTECLGLDQNPGDDLLVEFLRARCGKTGPEPTRWRDFCSDALAQVAGEVGKR